MPMGSTLESVMWSAPSGPEGRAGSWRELARLLRRHYRPGRLGNRRDPLAEAVFIVLSGQTEEYNYRRTFRRLRRRYRTWTAAAKAGEDALYHVIADGGLGRKKAGQLAGLFRAVGERFGRLDLEGLRPMPDDEAYETLVSLPGIGPKSARCVMLYALDRPAFPVDTHVWRVLGRIGGVYERQRRQPTPRQQAQLESQVPVALRYELHVNLLQHGRRFCRVSAPRCRPCPLATVCQFGQRSLKPAHADPSADGSPGMLRSGC